MITAIIPHFHKERIQNLQPITDALRADGVSEVIIWNNDDPLPPGIPVPARVIQSPRNLGCQGRFQAAMYHLHSDLFGLPGHVLFCDNDTIANPGSVGKLLRVSQAHPNDIVSGKWGYRNYGITRVPISFGQFELIPTQVVFRLLQGWTYDPELVFDDMWLCVRAYKLGISIQKVMTRRTVLEHGVGFRYTKERGDAAKVFRQMMKEL